MGGAASGHHGCGARQDREAQHKTVEAIPSTTLRAGLAEAALANAQLAVAKAVMQAEFRRQGGAVEEAVAEAEEDDGSVVLPAEQPVQLATFAV
jgi:hypothetical protein